MLAGDPAFKVKTSRWRGAATRLHEADRVDASVLVRLVPWWLGAAGYRREGDPADFLAWIRIAGSPNPVAVADLEPESDEIIWSTALPPNVVAHLLDGSTE
jgi:hypothetical protein